MKATRLSLSAIALCALFAGTAVAAPPSHAGGGKGGPPAHAGAGKGKGGGDHGKHDRGPSASSKGQGNDRGGPSQARGGGPDRDDRGRDYDRRDVSEFRFRDDDRVIVRDYYSDVRHCPPGLAKKNNGCMPPGQAKKWQVGHRLPRDVTYYDLPRELVIRLPPLSAGYKYVRIGADILQIAVGTGLVIDAIQDLGRI